MTYALLVQGLAFGDEGKGSIVDSLTLEHSAHTVVRFNGGSQAGHNVVVAYKHHTFAQFGSGTFAGADTHLSKFMLVNPGNLLREGARLLELGINDVWDRITVHGEALVTTPYHVYANRRNPDTAQHGTCGMGIGETMRFANDWPDAALRVKHLADPGNTRERLAIIKEHLAIPDGLDARKIMLEYHTFVDHVRIVGDGYLQDRFKRPGAIVFEGAQGALLDQDYGFHPHTTWSDCTFGNAAKLLEGSGLAQTRIGVLRTYMTRHGTGPLPTHDTRLNHPEPHNNAAGYQGEFRQGHFDVPLAKYALNVLGPIDALAITHIDRVNAAEPFRVCIAHSEAPDLWKGPRRPADLEWQAFLTKALAESSPGYVSASLGEPEDAAREIAAYLGVPIVVTSHGPTAADKRWWR